MGPSTDSPTGGSSSCLFVNIILLGLQERFIKKLTLIISLPHVEKRGGRGEIPQCHDRIIERKKVNAQRGALTHNHLLGSHIIIIL